MNKKIFLFLIISVMLASCDDLFSPAIENNGSLDDIHNNAQYAQGILVSGYLRIPTNGWQFSDMATDNAVSNDPSDGYRRLATGEWTSNSNAADRWGGCKAAIQYLNIFLAEADKVEWSKDPVKRTMFNDRQKGEAYGLRALFMYYLLQAHGGWVNGELLGVPIVLEPESQGSNFNLPRDTFEDCMQRIYTDLVEAEKLVPLEYNDIDDVSEIPAKYEGATVGQYNDVFGRLARQRIDRRITKAIRAQAALLAASPAFSEGNTTTWADAANYAADVLSHIGGISGMSQDGWKWYTDTKGIDALADGENPQEILWRTSSDSNLGLESDNYPPTLFGSGRVNPSQNLVDAFPMDNGYPILHGSSGYVISKPYEKRDPRLAAYVLLNGSTAGPANTKINTEFEGGTNDGLDKVATSTRTGYYMRKLLRQDVNLDPSSQIKQRHYTPRIRYTEIFLIYAEAANEAWGPDGKGTYGYSARDVLKALRTRAKVGVENGDPYLASITTKEDMRNLIHNERRLELCFEDFRFWDLRRWDNTNLTEAAKGMKISNGSYTEIFVENRVYDSHMRYGPIPYSEVLKFNALVQNTGW